MKIVMNQVHSANKETGTVYMTKGYQPGRPDARLPGIRHEGSGKNGGEDFQRRAGRPSFPVIQADRAAGKRTARLWNATRHTAEEGPIPNLIVK
ncbi:hypothetical protein [Hungatella sp.]|uniref:hypothetical protein n=1 Tax=Hungatella sp. TaxID=2613924 RepID=UPI0032E4BC0D